MVAILLLFSLFVSSVLVETVKVTKTSVCFEVEGDTAQSMLDLMREDEDTSFEDQPIDCGEVDDTTSGVYRIYPDGSTEGFDVFCDMETDNGGWTVFQRRLNGKTDFYKGWSAYEKGFGNLKEEFWLGNSKLHTVTSQGKYELRVDLEDFEDGKRYAKYATFNVGDSSTNYKLTVGGYSGTAGDSLLYQNGHPFSTKDKDNDSWPKHCSVVFKGAWWYKNCHQSNLNGKYLKGKHTSFADGIEWKAWKGYHYSMKKTSMMIRRVE